MSTLYRCRARVGYRPFKSDKVIVFDERQVQELTVDLKWKPGLGNLNQDNSTTPSAATNALNQSKCSVTISDPYLTGLAWPVLYDAAAIYTASNVASANNIIFPACTENQDPVADKCFRYVDIETDSTLSSGGDFAFIIISLWYDVAGTSFGTDFYFRVDGFGISHGSNYPNVTIKGVEARSVLFNQSLLNLTFDEGAEVEKVLKDIAERFDYSVSFCLNSNQDPQKKRLLPRSIRYKGVTADEAIQKILDSVGGTTSTLPMREYANKITMCTRGEFSNRTCSVFYLGKGLYERYEINGEPELTLIGKNQEFGSNENDGDPYRSESFESQTYVLQDINSKRREQELQGVKKLPFPNLFSPVSPHIANSSRVTRGFIWRTLRPAPSGSGGKIAVVNERVKDTNLFGISPNGEKAISFLKGIVREADGSQGRVVIATRFGLRVCKPDNNTKCFHRQIIQETTGLGSVSVKPGDEINENKEIGTSTKEKPEFTRFFINGHGGEQITLNPQIVWDWAVPEGELKRFTQSANSPVSSAELVIPPPPKAGLKNWNATTNQKPRGILIMAGHADDVSKADGIGEAQINIELVKWAQRNANAYGIADFVQFYIPNSGRVDRNSPSSQFSKTREAVINGLQVIEIHLDEPNGRSGVIPPLVPARGVPGFDPSRGPANKIWPLDDALAKLYGAFEKDHRSKPGDPAPLGIPNRGGTILEVGVLNSKVEGIFRTGTSAQRDALFKQLMDPVMRSIVTERNRGGQTAPVVTPQSTSDNRVFIGRVGSTGRSSAPHIHFQFVDGPSAGSETKLTEVGNKYIVAGGKPLGQNVRNQGYGAGRNHKGIDFFPDDRAEIYAVNGAFVKSIGETKCVKENSLSETCGGGFGNFVVVSTPDGDVILAHLAPKSIPPNISGLRSSSGGGNTRPNIQSNPVTSGLTVETSFKGIPRSLRIIPGQTILSFISDYDDWIEKGGPRGQDNGTDPGIWIPKRFSNWFITDCSYKWRSGDLRVDIEGRSAWGTNRIVVPSFKSYLETMKKAGDIKQTNDYYGYIRSIGDLNWKIEGEDGKYKDSTEVFCKEAQDWALGLGEQSSTQGANSPPTNVQNSFPPANCQYPGGKYPADRVNAIINAAKSAGVTSKAGYAGIVGNALHESLQGSFLNPSANNGNTRYGLDGCVGIFQWCDRRRGLRKFAQSLGKSEFDFGVQMQFFVAELTPGSGYTDDVSVINLLNSQTDPAQAALIFNRVYERAPGQGEAERQKYAREIFNSLKCSKT